MYIMTNKYDTVLYTGVTNNLQRRVWEHKSGVGSKFASKYRTTKLVYYEVTNSIKAAITREKQIKAGSRQKKIDLINSINSEWRDLAETL
ncbi:MAG: GIY-YIG nuclease family protein [Anaerolineales bacterium]